jgi:hypothetical protein
VILHDNERRGGDRAGQSHAGALDKNKALEREIISSFQIVQSLGFEGDYRQWKHLLWIHE